MAHELVIRGGTIVDGTGADRVHRRRRGRRRADRRRRRPARGRPRHRRRRRGRDAGLGRRAHALRRPGHVGRPARPVVQQRRHHAGHGQLRRRLRAVPAGRAGDVDRADGRRRGHPRQRARTRACRGARGRRFPEYLDFLGVAPLRARHRRAARPRLAALPRDARARRAATRTPPPTTSPRCAVSSPRRSAAGAVGFSTSRTIFHRSITRRGRARHLRQRRRAHRARPRAWPTAAEACSRRSRRRRSAPWRCSVASASARTRSSACSPTISRATGQKITFTTVQHVDDPDSVARRCSTSPVDDERVRCAAVPAGRVAAGRDPRWARRLPPVHAPTVVPRRSPTCPLAAQAERMRDPEVKARILAEADVAPDDAGSMEMFAVVMQGAADFLFGLDEVVDYEPGPERAFGADRRRARRARRSRRSTTSSPRATATNIVSLPGAGLHGGRPRRGARDAHAPGDDRRARRRRRAREAHLRRVEPEHAAHPLDPRPHPRRDASRSSSWSSSRRGAPHASTASTTAARSRWASAPTST